MEFHITVTQSLKMMSDFSLLFLQKLIAINKSKDAHLTQNLRNIHQNEVSFLNYKVVLKV